LRAANEGLLRDALALAGDAATRCFVHASSGSVDWPPHPSPAWQAYADLKRAQEAAALAWAETSGARLLFGRIFNMGGPYMTQAQNYALGSFIQQALAGGVIRIGARRPVVRSYAHCVEFARVVFELALDGDWPLAFDTAGTEAVELAGLAAAVGRALDLPQLTVERPLLESEAEDRYVGDGAVYRAALARAGLAPIGLDQIIRDTAAWLSR
jgi:nucleoside-diphosphate-sugar epimerase